MNGYECCFIVALSGVCLGVIAKEAALALPIFGVQQNDPNAPAIATKGLAIAD
jgi:hypothetical protein